MKLSTKAEYGIRAMVELAQAYGTGPVALGEIARAQALPKGYLEQLLARLRRSGLVVATRGARGGYTLASRPGTITAGSIIRALEGPIDLIQCASEKRPRTSCRREAACSSRILWHRLQSSIVEVLDTVTLADLYTVRTHQDIREGGIHA